MIGKRERLGQGVMRVPERPVGQLRIVHGRVNLSEAKDLCSPRGLHRSFAANNAAQDDTGLELRLSSHAFAYFHET